MKPDAKQFNAEAQEIKANIKSEEATPEYQALTPNCTSNARKATSLPNSNRNARPATNFPTSRLSFRGDNPEEAVAKLWLALQTK